MLRALELRAEKESREENLERLSRERRAGRQRLAVETGPDMEAVPRAVPGVVVGGSEGILVLEQKSS